MTEDMSIPSMSVLVSSASAASMMALTFGTMNNALSIAYQNTRLALGEVSQSV